MDILEMALKRHVCTASIVLAMFGLSLAGENTGQRVAVEVGPILTESWGAYPGHIGHKREKQFFWLDSGKEHYQLQHSCCVDPSHSPGVETPEGYIGMPGPVWEDWYGNGFLTIVVNGKDVGKTKPVVIRKLEEGKRGSVQIVWDREDVQVQATFLMLPGEPTLFVEVRCFPRKVFESIGLTLTAYPSAYTHHGDRWAITPSQRIRQKSKAALTPQKDTWLLFQDHKVERTGGCGVTFLPGEIAAGSLEVSEYPILARLECRAGARSVRCAIWDFHDKTNEQAEAWVRANVDHTRSLLGKMDFSCRDLKPEKWKELRASVVAMLSLVKDKPKLANEVSGLVKTMDEASRHITDAASAGQPPDMDTENRFLTGMERLKPLLWELRFAKLFSE